MSRQVVAISELPRIRKENPEALPILRVIVYDKTGTPSKIRAVELDRFLELGFLEEPPVEPVGEVEPPTDFVPPPRRPIVASFRAP